jgi:hypothetical protein
MWELANEISWDDMRKTDPTPKPQPARPEWRLNVGNRKPPPISLPRIRALETPDECGSQWPDKQPSK